MKIVHSFWSKPSSVKANSLEKFDGGWVSPKYHLMSWALSCLTIKEFYPNIELVTDNRGARLLVDQLDLPYHSVSTKLEDLSDYSPKLWALGKIFAYKLQKDPFIHVDGDVYIWDSFGKDIEKASLVAQNKDVYNFKEYKYSINSLKNFNFKFPELIQPYCDGGDIPFSINAGILGGNNIDFIQNFSDLAIDFVENNLQNIKPGLEESCFAIVYEQLLFALLAEDRKIPITYYFQEVSPEFAELSSFINKYRRQKYVHLLSLSKSSLSKCHELEMQLAVHYPYYYNRILSFVNHGGT